MDVVARCVHMFYVSVKKGVLDKVMEQAKSTDKEIIGILVGNIENHTIIIENAISGKIDSHDTRASLPPSTIAKVTDKIMKGEVEGRIVGWYHSHPGFGLFMSQTDVHTQNNLQQFSSKVTALIADPDDEDFGFFTLHESRGVVQLNEDQVHVFEEGEKKVPKRFSSPPKLPKPQEKGRDKFQIALPPSIPPKGPNMKLIAVGLAAAVICMAIGGMIFYRNFKENPEHSSVNRVTLMGESDRNQDNTSIFREFMEVQVNLTVVKGKITREGVRFYLGLEGLPWTFLGNDSTPFNNTFSLVINTTLHDEGIHQIKVNFTDSQNKTWEGVSVSFIIDNIPDIPQITIVYPRENDTLDSNVNLYAEVVDSESNINSVSFSYINVSNTTANWSKIPDTQYWSEFDVFITPWDTNPLPNGTYLLRITAMDRNKYMDEKVISVNIIHNG